MADKTTLGSALRASSAAPEPRPPQPTKPIFNVLLFEDQAEFEDKITSLGISDPTAATLAVFNVRFKVNN